MKKLIFIALGIFVMSTAFFSFDDDAVLVSFNANSKVQDVLVALGEAAPDHYLKELDPKWVQMGYELTHMGRTTHPDGGKSDYISAIFVCTDCHNQVKEDPILVNPNPEARLAYAVEKDLPFLQATTFWGMVDREGWYNEDYIIKYGDLVKPASTSLYESTQLCAQECSSGRKLEAWEWTAFQHYYQSIGLTLKDLNLTDKEMTLLERGARSNQEVKGELVKMLKSKYLLASPADFIDPPSNHYEGFKDLTGDAKNGKIIYERSCQTCHRYGGPSQLVLDDSPLTFKKFVRRMDKYNDPFNLYEIVRYGTHAQPGHRQYMPLYTADRMSNQQLEDLRAYIEQPH